MVPAAILTTSNASSLTDPVCGARLTESTSIHRSDHRGTTYFFCSMSCKMEFDDNPYAYTPAPDRS